MGVSSVREAADMTCESHDVTCPLKDRYNTDHDLDDDLDTICAIINAITVELSRLAAKTSPSTSAARRHPTTYMP